MSKLILKRIFLLQNIQYVLKPICNEFKILSVNFCSVALPVKRHNNTTGRINRKLVTQLEELFEVRPFVALDIMDNHKMLQTASFATIKENFDLCKRFRVNKGTLIAYADVLTHFDLSVKLEELKKLPFSLNKTIALGNLNIDALRRLVNRLEEESHTIPGGRIQYLADVFKSTPEFVCEELVKKPFMQSKDMSRIKNDVELLLSYDVYMEEIKRDLWVLRYSTDHLQERLKFAKENKVEHIKTWMMRATAEIFETYLRRKSDNKSVLGDSSLVEYLSNRLECSTEYGKYMVLKQPALKNKSMKKMREIIDFLLSQGFEPVHICRVPKILLHSVETSRKRLIELEGQGVHMGSLHVLTKSQKQYRQYYESLVKINQIRAKNKAESENTSN